MLVAPSSIDGKAGVSHCVAQGVAAALQSQGRQLVLAELAALNVAPALKTPSPQPRARGLQRRAARGNDQCHCRPRQQLVASAHVHGVDMSDGCCC